MPRAAVPARKKFMVSILERRSKRYYSAFGSSRGQRGRTAGQVASRKSTQAVRLELLNESFRIGRKETLCIPGGNGPFSKGGAAVDERRNTNGFLGNTHVRGNHGHSVARSGQRDQRLRGSALQKH